MKKDSSLFHNHKSYIDYCLHLVNDKLLSYDTVADIEKCEATINLYKNIDSIEEPNNLFALDEDSLSNSDYERAYQCIMNGKLFSEHAAAGEATRLGIGAKYLINIVKDLPLDKIVKIMSKERDFYISSKTFLKKAQCHPQQLLSLSLGTRHMLQFSFDIYKLAKKHGYDPATILSKQKMLIVLSRSVIDEVIGEFISDNFFGFKRNNVFFMVQQKYHGINLINGKFIYDKNTPRRLHNHGQLVMQQTMDDQIFTIDKSMRKNYLKSYEIGELLKQMDDKISYNIDDLDYLTGAIDYEGLAFALKQAENGYAMVMEVVKNNPENPQKGGMAVFDKILGRNVMIEGFQLNGIQNHEIKYLNKNFNHYPKPYKAWSMLKKHGLNMPIAVKQGYIYFQPVQGDINFLVKTEFLRRKTLKPIHAWKSPATTPLAVQSMRKQDMQEEFLEYAEHCMNKRIC